MRTEVSAMASGPRPELHSIPALGELARRLRSAWSAETSYCPDAWSPDNPAEGQCAVSALIIQDALGGELVRGCFADGTHYWNRLDQGGDVDVTEQQFSRPPRFDPIRVVTREYVLSSPDTRRRYEKLLAAFRKS